MTAASKKVAITSPDWVALNPLAGVSGLGGVRVDYVGQGDAVSILDQDGRTILRIDYGGRESRPFSVRPLARRQAEIDMNLPVLKGDRIFLTHWDEDHWCSAGKTSQAGRKGRWLTPRQWTSPRAATAAARMNWIRCIPRHLERTPIRFLALNGDELWLEKLQHFDAATVGEDCNLTGVAFSLVQKATGRVVLLPGDAPVHRVPHYARYVAGTHDLLGLVAHHHGSHTHWVGSTHAYLHQWSELLDVIVAFSCGDPNSDEHPDLSNYEEALPKAQLIRTARGVPVRISF